MLQIPFPDILKHRTMASTGGRRTLKRTSARVVSSFVEDIVSPMSIGGIRNNPGPDTHANTNDSSASSDCRKSQTSVTGSLNHTTGTRSDTTLTSYNSITKSTPHSKDISTSLRPQRSGSFTTVEALNDLSRDSLVKEQVLLKLKRHVPHLLESFCIVDLESDGNPVVATSTDLLPAGGPVHGKPRFLHGEWLGQSWQITAERYGSRQKYHITISGDLYDPTGDRSRASQRFFGHLELTDLVDAVRHSKGDVWTSEDPPPDVWLEIALEEMDARGMRVRRRPKRGTSKNVSRKDQLDLAMDLVRYIHKDYFVLGSSDVAGVYHIAHVSPSLLQPENSTSQPPDFSAMTAYLAKGEKYCCEIAWGSSRIAYCLPMTGQQLHGWLCFLVEDTLPPIW